MCGIVGAVSAGPVEQDLIERMRDCLTHRGPDAAGIWSSPDGRVCLGHRRLSIVDLSPEANQPFVSRDGRFVVTFNGEIYNFRELRKDLEVEGIHFFTNSDTEVLIESFRRWGERCTEHLSGMFAFAIWDNLEKRLFCARDRAGEKPFYYAIVNGDFVFASELKSLVDYPGFRRDLDYTALADFLSFGFVPDPKSIWKNCQKLPPGQSLTVETAADGWPVVGKPNVYWDWQLDPDYSVTDWQPRILETLQRASREMSFADVPVGTFLSGGVDSSSVTAALSKSGCDVQTFTIGFDNPAYDERPWARQVAGLYNTRHTERTVQADDLSADLDRLLWHYDEPFNDYSYLPTYHVCREARKSITVALSGDGGDELFAGYRKYQRLALRQNVNRFLPITVNMAAAVGAGALLPNDGRLRRTVSQYAMDDAAMMLDSLTLGLRLPELRAVARGELRDALRHYSPMEVITPLLEKVPPSERGLINSMRYLDLKLTLAGDILVKVDRASMAVSLEVRPVYLHRDILDLAARIPPRLLADRRHSKEVLKQALRPWLPKELLYRRKQGFAMPLKNWIGNGVLHSFAHNDVKNPVDALLDPMLIKAAAAKHLSGRADMTSVIHSIYLLKKWLTRWA